MVNAPLLTPFGARLQLVRKSGKEVFNWLFLPGGPGLGSESLLQLLDILELPGTIWRLDLPGDGSNTTLNNRESFAHWEEALIEAVTQFTHVVVVAHSTGGMYLLSAPEVEPWLEGLILLDSAPNSAWQTSFGKIVEKFPISELVVLQEKYKQSPTNESLKEVTIASAPYLFAPRCLSIGIQILETLPYNYEACQWSEEHFDQTYEAKWIPKTIPTLILGGEEDRVTPLSLFLEAREFQRENIEIKSIKQGGHFPWIENPAAVIVAFKEYSRALNQQRLK